MSSQARSRNDTTAHRVGTAAAAARVASSSASDLAKNGSFFDRFRSTRADAVRRARTLFSRIAFLSPIFAFAAEDIFDALRLRRINRHAREAIEDFCHELWQREAIKTTLGFSSYRFDRDGVSAVATLHRIYASPRAPLSAAEAASGEPLEAWQYRARTSQLLQRVCSCNSGNGAWLLRALLRQGGAHPDRFPMPVPPDPLAAPRPVHFASTAGAATDDRARLRRLSPALLPLAAAAGNVGACELLLREHKDMQLALPPQQPQHPQPAGAAAAATGASCCAASTESRCSRTTATALIVAAARNDLRLMELLIKHGADVNARRLDGGETPLLAAIAHGNTAAVLRLIFARADLGLANAGGWTPLAAAISSGNLEIVRTLLALGAPRAWPRGAWSSLADLAEVNGMSCIAEELSK